MSRQSLLDWVVCVTANLLPSQSCTLALLVAAAVRTERFNLAALGRKLAGPTTANRAWRFTDNARVKVADAMAGTIARLVRTRKKRLLVSFDWTGFRSFHTLMAAWRTNRRARECSVFTIGRAMLDRTNYLPEDLLRRVRWATIQAATRWG